MGWGFTYMDTRGRSTFDLICDEHESHGDGEFRHRVVAHNVTSEACYMAMRDRRDPSEVFGIVILYKRQRDRFGTKGMDDRMGPYFYGASRKVLDALTPTDNEVANEWRAKCREQLEAKRNAPRAIRAGDIVRFDAEWLETECGTRVFRASKWNGKTMVFHPIVDGVEGRPWRLRGWSKCPYTIVTEQQAVTA